MSDEVVETYGLPNCPSCGGRGRVTLEPKVGYVGPPALQLCTCVLHRDILKNVERGMPGLSKAPRVPTSPLLSLVEKDVWVTANEDWFWPHLRHVAVRRPPTWSFFVATDADLMTAWLATKALEGAEIIDTDTKERVALRSLRHLTLTDIAVPSDLLVVRLGIKSARNQAMPEVLLETIRLREHENKPTWLWDQPGAPLDRDDHRCHDPVIIDNIAGWTRVLASEWELQEEKRALLSQPRGPSVRDTLLGKPRRVEEAPPEEVIETPEPSSDEEPASEPGDDILRQFQGRKTPKNKRGGGSRGKFNR